MVKSNSSAGFEGENSRIPSQDERASVHPTEGDFQDKKRQASHVAEDDRPTTRSRFTYECIPCQANGTECNGSLPGCTRSGSLDTTMMTHMAMKQELIFVNDRTSPPEADSTNRTPHGTPPLLFEDDREVPHENLEVMVSNPWQNPYHDDYKYSRIGPDHIRLLLLSKGRSLEPIYCALKTMDFTRLESAQLVYQALSYAWGQEPARHEIYLQDINVHSEYLGQNDFYRLAASQAVPKRFHIRPNLYKALKQLRSETNDLWFWTDALCINQKDDEEKSHQIPKMLGIYSNALNVCIWLGDSGTSDEGHRAMDFIPSIVNLKLLDRMTSRTNTDEDTTVAWIAFVNLLRRPWFSRRWVIQELAAARNASVQCGSRSINWIDFADSVQLFMTKLEQIRAIYENSEISKTSPDGLNDAESLGATTIVNAASSVLRRTESGSILDRIWNIESLVIKFQHFEASDPRDTIFALLSLASDGHMSMRGKICSKTGDSLTPDYTKPALQTYIEFFRHCILASGSLDIICRHWALPVPSQSVVVLSNVFPSWIGLVKDSAFGPPSRLSGRLNGDSLVGEPGHRIYNASRGRAPKVHFGREETLDPADKSEPFRFMSPLRYNSSPPTDSPGPHKFDNGSFTGTLFAKGICLSRVSRVSSRVVDGTISDECLAMGGWKAGMDVNQIPDRLWRTPVADRAGEGKNAPFWYRRACMYCLRRVSPDGDLNTSKLIANKSLPETVIEYLKRIQSIVWSRKFLVCHESNDQSKSLFGLGSRNIQEGDLVCILFGCSVPVVLRYRNLTFMSAASYYEFIGECYIHGKMDGEALANLDEEAISKSTIEFNIR